MDKKKLVIAYLGNFSVDFSTESHIKKTLEDLGHKVFSLQENNVDIKTVVRIANKCDLFLWTRTYGWLKGDGNRMLRMIKVPTASYHLDLYIGISREAQLTKDAFWKTDFVFTPDGNQKSAKIFKRNRINHFYIKPGVYDKECYIANPHAGFMHDVVFVGNWQNYHPEWPYRKQLVEFLAKTYGERFRFYPNAQTKCIRGDELNTLYNSAKVIIGDSLCKNFKHDHYWSDRATETIGRGGFLIHPYIKGMEEELQDKKHIVYYPFGDFKKLKELIDWYVACPVERLQIKLTGHLKVKRFCTYKNRIKQMLGVLNDGTLQDKNLSKTKHRRV